MRCCFTTTRIGYNEGDYVNDGLTCQPKTLIVIDDLKRYEEGCFPHPIYSTIYNLPYQMSIAIL